MELFNDFYRVQSTRLQEWDYRSPGYYFVTINTRTRESFFGEINGEIRLNEIGNIAQACWMNIPSHFPHVEIDEFIIMPDHVHGIIVIRRDVAAPRRDAVNRVSTDNNHDFIGGITGKYNPMLHDVSLPKIIRYYKGRVTYEINRTCPKIQFKWQPRYYDRVIRNDNELFNTRKYIRENPANCS